MRKYLVAGLTALAMLFGLTFHHSAMAGQQGAPEATVKNFYTWFIKRSAENHGYPLMDKDIFRYVSNETVDALRTEYKKNAFAENAEYFTNVQDFDEKDWTDHMFVRPAIMLDDVALVAITLGSTDKKTNVAFLRKFNGVWKITKVVDTEDYR